MGYCTFGGCKSIQHVKLPEHLEYINWGMFAGCKNLKVIEIPSSVDYISQGYININGTFAGCENLTSFRILNSSNKLRVGYNREEYSGSFTESDWWFWTETITDLFLDRGLAKSIPVPNLERLELGASIKQVQIIDINELQKLTCIKCNALEPPTLATMSNRQYMDLEVIVPEEALDAYRSAPSWKNFWNLRGDAGIEEDVMQDAKQIVSRISLAGTPVDEDYHGVVIIRYSDGSVSKLLQ